MLATKVLKYGGFVLMVLVGLALGLFAGGYAMTDPGGVQGVGMIGTFAVPVVALCLLALWRPRWTWPVLAVLGVGALVLQRVLFTPGGRPNLLDRLGPVGAISVLGVAVAMAFLGLRLSTLAGVMLVVLAAGQLALLMPLLGSGDEGPGLGALLATSSGVGVVPIAVAGLLFLAAGLISREPLLGPPEQPPGDGTPRRPASAHAR